MFNGHTAPSDRYKRLIVEGMTHHGCDAAAIQDMRKTPTQEDPSGLRYQDKIR